MDLRILALNVLRMNAKFTEATLCISVTATAGSFRQRNIHGSARCPGSGALMEQLVLECNKNIRQTRGQSVGQLTSAHTQGNKKELMYSIF
jgi:hypothetical protein